MKIVLGSYMVRYPLGGMMSWVLQYLVGFARLGHQIYFVEKAGYPDACFDPVRGCMTDDCTHGTRAVRELLSRFDLGDRWCFVDYHGRYHGMPPEQIEHAFATADVFIDMGTHGAWLNEAEASGLRVLIDGEPAFTQLKMEKAAGQGTPERYDAYFTTGQNIGTASSTAPTGGKRWRHLFHPVCLDVFPAVSAPKDPAAAYTTVMNWQSYEPIAFGGVRYEHKNVEFQKFLALPKRTTMPLEVAVSGQVPYESLAAAGWRVRSAHEVTRTFDTFAEYVRGSRGEFGVCKNGYVVSNSGWFSDRSAAYLASGRPVILQETGFSMHLPTGRGLFAVRDEDEAAAAIEMIEADYPRHVRAAREIAAEYLASEKVLGRLLNELGLAGRKPLMGANA